MAKSWSTVVYTTVLNLFFKEHAIVDSTTAMSTVCPLLPESSTVCGVSYYKSLSLILQVLVGLLKHRTARSNKSVQSSLGREEVIRQLTMLGNRRTTWREANDDYKALQKDDHKRILQQGDEDYMDELFGYYI